MSKIFKFFDGRTTFFACAWFLAGVGLAAKGKLTGEFIGFMTALHTLTVAHSVSQNSKPGV